MDRETWHEEVGRKQWKFDWMWMVELSRSWPPLEVVRP